MKSAMVRCLMAYSYIAWSWGGSVACGSIFLILLWPTRMATSVLPQQGGKVVLLDTLEQEAGLVGTVKFKEKRRIVYEFG